MNSIWRIGGVVACLLVAASLLAPTSGFPPLVVEANTGCPGSTNAFGLLSVLGDCTITLNTVWGNGTLTLTGNLNVNSGTVLTLWNLVIGLNPSLDQQYRIYVAGGHLVVHGGTLTSANPAFGWRLETSSDSGSLVEINGTNVLYAGSGSSSGFLIQAGNGHRFQHLTVTNSALGSSKGVIDVNGPGVSDLRVENSTFTGTGTAYWVHASAIGANLVFRDSTITSFAGLSSSPAVFAENTQVENNTINSFGAPGIALWGGGPGWPFQNEYSIIGNTIATYGNAITTSNDSRGYDILYNRIIDGHAYFDGNGNRFAYNNITGTDERVTCCHIVWTSPNSSFDHNALWNVGLTQDAGFVVTNYGNVKVTDNRLFLRCYGNNCMGTEVINVQAAQRPIYPGFPTVEVARNRVTWTTIAPGGLTVFLDNEFSQRLWLHDNTEVNAAGGGVATSSLQGGGVLHSLYENNTIFGPTTYCIYDYIYADAGNVFQNNRCDGALYGGIFQTGGNVYRNNVFANVTAAGVWICPNSPCAGANVNTENNALYNNTFTFSGTRYLTRMSLGNAFDNVFLGHGASAWTDGSTGHPVYGDWLFFANGTITHVGWTDTLDGHRTLNLVTGGTTYWDRETVPGVGDSASLSVDGSIDQHGSVYGGTVLWSLYPHGSTALNLMGTGPVTLAMRGFVSNYTYNVTLQDSATRVYSNRTVTMNADGSGQFVVNLGTTVHSYSIKVWGAFPGSPQDTTPPTQVTDLRIFAVEATSVVLRWTAPGNNGTVGQAVEYDLRYSTSGPISGDTFNQATFVPTPPPGLPGTTEQFTVSGLQPGTRYWFALRTADSVPNWSPISNVADVVTGSGSAAAPTVSGFWASSSSGTIDVLFTDAMDRSSVNASFQITPNSAYHLVWESDSHLQVVFDTPLQPGVWYVLTLSPNATDSQGRHLAAPWVYAFEGATFPGGPTFWSSGLLLLIFATLVGIAVVALFVCRRRVSGFLRRTRRLERRRAASLRRKASRVEDGETTERDQGL
jgi:Fibronectin type III domain